MKTAVMMALLGLTGAAELEQPVVADDNVLAELREGENIDDLCQNYSQLDDDSLLELSRTDYQNHAKIAAKNKEILRTEAVCKKWVLTHKRHNVICKWCAKNVKPSTIWKFYKGVWYRWHDGGWHYYGPSRDGFGGRWRWSGGYWHYNGYAFRYVNGKWERFYNGKWHYYRKMVPINPAPPKSPKFCVQVMHMVKAGVPGALATSTVPRCQVGRAIYMWSGSKTCKILGGKKVNQRIAKCKAGYAHKWQKVTRCTGGDIYKPQSVHERLDIQWKSIGTGVDISYGGGMVWTTYKKIGSNLGIFYKKATDPNTIGFRQMPGAAVRVAAKPDGSAYVVNSAGGIYSSKGTQWTRLSGSAKDIGVGSNGKMWVIGTNREAGGYGIYRRDGAKWTKIAGSALKIAVNGKGNAWVVNKHNDIFEYSGSKWIHRPGKAIDVGAYGDSVMVVGTDRNYYRFNHKTGGWAKATGSGGVAVSVGPDGQAFASTVSGMIYKQNN